MELQYEQELHVRKSLVMRATQIAGSLLLKMLKYFEVVFTFLDFPPSKKLWNLDWFK